MSEKTSKKSTKLLKRKHPCLRISVGKRPRTRRKVSNLYEQAKTQLATILAENGMDGLTPYTDESWCDEAPLFSRIADVDFIADNDVAINEVTARWALDYLRQVEDSVRPGDDTAFCALTYASYDYPRLIPRIFVCHGDAVIRYADSAKPKRVRSKFSREVLGIFRRIAPSQKLHFLEDKSIPPEDRRVYISYMSLSAVLVGAGVSFQAV